MRIINWTEDGLSSKHLPLYAMRRLPLPEANLEAFSNDSSKGPTLTNAKVQQLAGAHDIDQLPKIRCSTRGDTAEMSNLAQDRLSIKMALLVPSWGRSLVFLFLPR
jgi:hypothetical protein